MTDKVEKRIFVGGLAKNVTSEELTEKFSRFGEVGQIEIKTRDSELGGKTFAYVNMTADENGFKKCFTAYSNTKWKGGVLKLQFAKKSFISKLKKEHAEAKKDAESRDATPTDVHTSPVWEEHNKKAIPGTQIDEEGTWVMGKYSRVLPVLHMKKPGSKKLVTLDPSKTLHSLKRLKCDEDQSPTNDSSSLTWSLEEKDSEMTKRRKGEFPVWQAPPKEPIFSRLQGLAKECHVSDTEMEIVPVGRPVSSHLKPVGTNSKVYDSSDSDNSVETDKIPATVSHLGDRKQRKDSDISKKAKTMQDNSLKKSPKLNQSRTPPFRGLSMLAMDDDNEKCKKGQKIVLEKNKSGGSNTNAYDSSNSESGGSNTNAYDSSDSESGGSNTNAYDSSNSESGGSNTNAYDSSDSKSGGSNTNAYDSSDSDSVSSVPEASDSLPGVSGVNRNPEFQVVKTTQPQKKAAKLNHPRTPPFKGLSMLSSSSSDEEKDPCDSTSSDDSSETEESEQRKAVTETPKMSGSSSRAYDSSDSEVSSSVDENITKTSQSGAKPTLDSSLKKSPKSQAELAMFQGLSAGEAKDKGKNRPGKVLSENPTLSGSNNKAYNSSDSALSGDQAGNSDISEEEKGPQFHFVKTPNLQGRCLKMSTKLTQVRTPAFKGLSMLSSSSSDDEKDPCEKVKYDSGGKRTLRNDISTDHDMGKTTDETGNPKELVSKTSKRKDERKSGPQLNPEVPKNVKQKQTKAEDGLTAIQRSHQARIQNMAEVTLRESIVTRSLREGSSSKRIKFSDSDSEGQVVIPVQEQKEEKQAISLFDDSSSDSEDKEGEHDFSIRPQFEGKKGQKLMELQSKFKDSRFRMDDRFAESDSEEDDDHDKAPAPEKDSLQETLAAEKARNLSILEKVLGYVPRQRKQPVYQEMKRYVDPEKSKHLEMTPASNQSRKAKQKQLDPLDDSSGDSMDGRENNRKVIVKTDDDSDEENEKGTAETEECESSDGNDEDNEDDNQQIEDAAVDMPECGNSDTGKLSELFAGGSAFSFFGTTEKDSSEEESEAESEAPNSKSGTSEVKFGMSQIKSGVLEDKTGMSDNTSEEEPGMSDNTSEEEPGMSDNTSEEEPEVSTNIEDQDMEEDCNDSKEEGKKDKEPKIHRVAEPQPSFMIARDDPRLQAARKFFKRPPEDEYEDVVREFPNKRQKIMQMVREKHKQALRKERRVQSQHWKGKRWPGKKFKKF